MIRAVIFDFGNVICSFDVNRFLLSIAEATGRPPELVGEIYSQISPLARQYETGMVSSDQFFSTITKQYDLRMPKEDFVHAFTNVFTPVPGTIALIRSL